MQKVSFLLACFARAGHGFNPTSSSVHHLAGRDFHRRVHEDAFVASAAENNLQHSDFRKRTPTDNLMASAIAQELQTEAPAMAANSNVGAELETFKAAPPMMQEVDPRKMEEAYEQCKKVTSMASKTFSLGASLLDEEQQKAMWAIYTWCRRTDDLVDSPLAMLDSEKMTSDLAVWRARTQGVWEGHATDTLDLTLLDTRRKYPSLSIEPFFDMIEGMKMDTPQFGQTRYQTWDDLYLYCYRVASTVGLMTLPVFGTAPGYTEEEAKGPAIALGIALQITNILRDVGEDARRGRIYLPLEDMERFGVTEDQILNNVMDENYVKLVKFYIQRARDYYQQAQEGIPALAPSARLGVQAASDVYGQILRKIEDNDYDNFKKRAFVPSLEKLSVLLSSWWTVNSMPKATA